MISISSLWLPLVGMTTRFVLRWYGAHRKIRSKLAVGPLGRGAHLSLCRVHGPYLGVRQVVEVAFARITAVLMAVIRACGSLPGIQTRMIRTFHTCHADL